MSAWLVLSTLGFYSVDPVSGNYILGSPLFENATVDLGYGRLLEIDVHRSDPSHVYIQAFSLNETPQRRAWFHHEIAQGGKLSFQIGPKPDMSFGAAPETAPPSLKL